MIVINRSNSPIVLQRIELHLLRKGEVVQSRYLLSQELESRAQRAFTLFEQGALAEAEKEFRIKELFQNATLSRSNRLEPNRGLLIRDQYLQFGGDVEKIRVIAVGIVGDGSVVQSAGEISLISYQPKTKLNFPLNGTWYVSNATDVSGSHRWGIGQEFAYDLVKVDEEGNSGKGDETKPESYFYPKDVVGMVLVDSSHEEETARWLAMIPPEIRKEMEQAGGRRLLGGVQIDLQESQRQMKAANWQTDVPLIVLSRGRSSYSPDDRPPRLRSFAPKREELRIKLQEDLASRSSRSKHIFAEKSGHMIHHDQPELVIDAIRQVVEATRVKDRKGF